MASRWEDRREHLMGMRRPDGRTLDVGKLLALRHVEVVRATDGWRGVVPRLIDTPWIPTFHNARRSDLILSQAQDADVLVIISLPEPYEPEEWVKKLLLQRPRLAQRTILAFNQIDTIDTSQIFSRGGFAEAYAESVEAVAGLGVMKENTILACSRLPFLERGATDEFLESRRERLNEVLARISRLASDARDAGFKKRLLAACDAKDAGLETLRELLDGMWQGPVAKDRVRRAVDTLAAVLPGDVREEHGAEWVPLVERAKRISMGIW